MCEIEPKREGRTATFVFASATRADSASHLVSTAVLFQVNDRVNKINYSKYSISKKNINISIIRYRLFICNWTTTTSNNLETNCMVGFVCFWTNFVWIEFTTKTITFLRIARSVMVAHVTLGNLCRQFLERRPVLHSNQRPLSSPHFQWDAWRQCLKCM